MKGLAAAGIALTFALGGTEALAQSGATLQTIARTQTIRLGFLREAVPFSFADGEGKATGYSVDLCQRVVTGLRQKLNLAKLDVKWVEVTTANRFDRLTDGTIDLECGTSTITLSRQKQVNFTLMTWADGGGFLVKPDMAVRGLIDLDGRKIGVLQGTTTEPALRQALTERSVKATLVPFKEHLEGLKALGSSAIDAYASDQTVLFGLAVALRGQIDLRMADVLFSYEPYGLALRRNDSDFKLAVDEVLARLYRTGEILEVYERSFGALGKPPAAIIALYNLNGLPE
jgi:polar amino acid transport system substrate-binding protein/glutamate/aspartate transport system substrate-binding protein